MKGIVLAGGEGRRLKPLTQNRPKPLLPVAGRPCVDYVLRSLINSGVRELIVTTAFMSDALIKSISEGLAYDASILYSFEATPAGTAGSVKRVANFIDDTFVVAMGDVLVDLDVRPLVEFHRRKKSVATIALTEVEDPTEYGIVGLDKGGRIQRFKEKPTKEEAFSNLVNAGIYVLEPEVLDLVPDNQPFDFSKNVFPAILAKGLPIFGMKIEGVWIDIGRPKDLIRASLEVVRREGTQQRLLGVEPFGPAIVGKGLILEEGVRLSGPLFVGNGVRIGRGAIVEGACLYDGATVEPGATIRESVVLEEARVGRDAEVLGSVLSRRSVVEEQARLSESILGEGMTVKARSRLDGASIAPP
ncbi:MAG TPA: NDP-sugar synthase [Thermoplasmata archaeon]|jgi:mannose-1-phosphate guanylyltransferase|nr:NDP-sugar synthase [Thermoplasmata archaeon]